MPPLPLSPEEFARAFRLGLGRALLHVREFGREGVLRPLLQGALFDLTYDVQTEGDWGDWVNEFFADGGHDEVLVQGLVSEFDAATETSRHEAQRARLLYHLAVRGRVEAKPALYRAYQRSLGWQFGRVGDEELLALDGEAALRWMVRLLQAHSVEWGGVDSAMCDYDELYGE